MLMGDFAAYGGLFLASLVAATILPAQSEAVLAGLIAMGKYPVWVLVTVASVGNILGSLLNWLLGLFIERYRHARWFPVSEANLHKAQQLYQRFGYWSLLGAWLPIVGDPLTVVAGVMREPLWRFLLLVSIGKIARYLAIAGLIHLW